MEKVKSPQASFSPENVSSRSSEKRSTKAQRNATVAPWRYSTSASSVSHCWDSQGTFRRCTFLSDKGFCTLRERINAQQIEPSTIQKMEPTPRHHTFSPTRARTRLGTRVLWLGGDRSTAGGWEGHVPKITRIITLVDPSGSCKKCLRVLQS